MNNTLNVTSQPRLRPNGANVKNENDDVPEIPTLYSGVRSSKGLPKFEDKRKMATLPSLGDLNEKKTFKQSKIDFSVLTRFLSPPHYIQKEENDSIWNFQKATMEVSKVLQISVKEKNTKS